MKINGVEALVRWQHPELGLIPPKQFISLAEETGLIVPLGAWVLRTACSQVKAWQEQGLPPLRITVNLSARQFQQPDLVETITREVDQAGLDPRLIELEITESVAMQDMEDTIAKLKRLSALGITLSIDDFGTGYSSLNYLKKLPIQTLKIDRSFLHEVTTNHDDAMIVSAVIVLAHSLKMKVIAEGVENREQLEFLKARQCTEMQGYLFSVPLPADSFVRRFAAHPALAAPPVVASLIGPAPAGTC
jgi:EAL domain-containing protein (putative c-di-GMP-specific phosphodiesterase class I)